MENIHYQIINVSKNDLVTDQKWVWVVFHNPHVKGLGMGLSLYANVGPKADINIDIHY